MQNNIQKELMKSLDTFISKCHNVPMISDITSVRDFYTRFCPTEEKAVEVIAEWRWNGKPVCPFCTAVAYKCADRYKCSACNKRFSVRTGTIMQASKIPLQQWLYAIYVLTTHVKGISSIALSKELGITQKSAWYMGQKIRECSTEEIKLENIVEMDETFIGGKEGNKHKNKKLNKDRGTVGKTAVMGAIQRDTKKVVAYPVEGVNTSTVGNFINRNMEQDTSVIADDYGAYDRHTNLRVNHRKGQYVDGDIHTNSIESYWAIVKRGQMGVYHWWSKEHLHRYMREFSYRFNNRNVSNTQFINNVVVSGIGKIRPFKRIIAEGIE